MRQVPVADYNLRTLPDIMQCFGKIKRVSMINSSNSNDQKLFGLCEFQLADDKAISPRIKLSKRDRVINKIINIGGVAGVIIVYIVMVMRKTPIPLAVFRGVAILDIRPGLMLRKSVIAEEYRDLLLQRFHFPSPRILRELISAYERYNDNIGKHSLERLHQSTNSTTVTEIDAGGLEIHDISKRAASSSLYLSWLLHFYIHRSICLSNSHQILSNVKNVVTIEEYTPQIAGYLSAFIDLGLPINLYLAIKLTRPKHTLNALSIFNKVILTHGVDADFIKLHYKGAICLEKRLAQQVNFNFKVPPRVGIFLSSYYESDNEELTRQVSELLIPFIHKVWIDWGADSVSVSCHPNDARPKKMLMEYNIHVNNQVIRQDARMNNYDLVIVGNSSVTEEALRMGVPVVYTGALDTYVYDLYGYVQSGLVIDATKSLPTLVEVCAFYGSSITKQKHFEFNNGTSRHNVIDFVDAICF